MAVSMRWRKRTGLGPTDAETVSSATPAAEAIAAMVVAAYPRSANSRLAAATTAFLVSAAASRRWLASYRRGLDIGLTFRTIARIVPLFIRIDFGRNQFSHTRRQSDDGRAEQGTGAEDLRGRLQWWRFQDHRRDHGHRRGSSAS